MMKKLIFILTLLLPLLADDYEANWSYYRDITLNTKSTGAGVSSDVLNFPILIRLTSGNMTFANADGDGHDIRFAKTDGTHLYYERERYDSTNALAEFWVLVDTVHGNDSSTYLRMYYGEAAAGDSSNGAAVFDTANGFAGVWHLDSTNAGTGDTDVYLDATFNTNNGDDYVSDTGKTGIIAKGQKFDGTDDYIDLGAPSSLQPAHVTLSGWGYLEAGYGNYPRLLGSTNNYAYRMQYHTGSNEYRWEYGTGSGYGYVDHSGSVTGSWQYLAGTYDLANLKIYVNGDSSNVNPETDAISYSGLTGFCIGRRDNNSRFWKGYLDEIRVSNVARSTDWIKLCYQNQQATDSLVSVGAEQTIVTYGNIVWNNANSTYIWNDADNWDLDRLPTELDTALYNATSTDTCTWDINFKVCSLAVLSTYSGNIRAGSSVDTVLNGALFDGSGTFFMESSTLNLYAGIGVGSMTINGGTSSLRFKGGGACPVTSSGESFYDVYVDSAEVSMLDAFSFNDFAIGSDNDKTVTTNADGIINGDFILNGSGAFDCSGDSLAMHGDFTSYSGTDVKYDGSTVWYVSEKDKHVLSVLNDSLPYINFGGSSGDTISFE